MSRDSRSSRFFVFMVVGMLVVMYFGLMFVSTGDKCGKDVKHWQWLPPTWVCGPG